MFLCIFVSHALGKVFKLKMIKKKLYSLYILKVYTNDLIHELMKSLSN